VPRVLHADDLFWRPSNQLGVPNTDLAAQLEARTLGARLWRLAPGQYSTLHRHVEETELYVVLAGRGRIRVAGEVHTLEPLSACWSSPRSSGRSSTTPTRRRCGSSPARRPSRPTRCA
jgi:quercetin dioxygenase-like cupin family protein